MSSRAETLARIHQALRTGVLPAAQFNHTPPASEIDQVALIASFVREAQAGGAEVFQPAASAAVVTHVFVAGS